MLSLQVHPLIPGYLAELSGSPEKAGVGGSIPSLEPDEATVAMEKIIWVTLCSEWCGLLIDIVPVHKDGPY